MSSLHKGTGKGYATFHGRTYTGDGLSFDSRDVQELCRSMLLVASIKAGGPAGNVNLEEMHEIMDAVAANRAKL